MPREPGAAATAAMLAIQTALASFLFWQVFPIFQAIVTQVGAAQAIGLGTEATLAAAVVLMQVSYWARYRWVPLRAPLHSVVVGHIVIFAGRASFFFGGALFSAIFFRHVPQLAAMPPFWQGAAKALGVMAMLFALFCYSLELDRLGRAIEEPPPERRVDRG